MPVQKSDVLAIPGEEKWITTPVTWKQSLKEYRKNYLCIPFTNTRAGEVEESNILFVSEELLDNFKSSKIGRTDTGFKLTVDNDYVYGQQKGNKNRFLVYHDKSRSIFQHRFIEGAMVVFSRQATDFSKMLGYGDVRVVSDMMAGLIGDKLHDFDRD